MIGEAFQQWCNPDGNSWWLLSRHFGAIAIGTALAAHFFDHGKPVFLGSYSEAREAAGCVPCDQRKQPETTEDNPTVEGGSLSAAECRPTIDLSGQLCLFGPAQKGPQ